MTDTQAGDEVRSAIIEVLIRYATGIDTRDWVLFRSCFTDDCDADYGDIGHWHGGDQITAWMAETHDPLGPTMHRLSNIAVTHDGGQVKARSYVHAIIELPGRSAVHAYGTYDDEVVLANDGPRIGRRRYTHVTTEFHTDTSP
jgi:3-phenylpropionate/cinnamic acid dioxygenase small subunit